MITSGKVVKVMNETIEGANKAVEKLKQVKDKQVQNLLVMTDEDDIYNSLLLLVRDIDTIYTAQIVDGIGLPQRIVKILYTFDNGKEFTLVLRSKLKAQTKYIQKYCIKIDNNIIDEINKSFADFLSDMFLIEVANENVATLNEKIEDLCKEYKLPFVFGFDVIPENGAPYVTKISDKEVRFSVDILNAKSISELALLQSGDKYNELVQKEAQDNLLTSLLSVQTTPQLVKAKVELIRKVTGVVTKKHANKIIRESYHRNAKYLDSLKSGDVYYNKLVKIDGIETDIFAIVHKDLDGTLSLVLSPFDTDTLFNVDFDVIGDLMNE